MLELSVVISLYNEEENLPLLWPPLREGLDGPALPFEGVFVPGGSSARGAGLYRGFHRFIPTLLKMRGYRVVEIPVDHRPRRFGQSKYGVLNRVFVAFADLLVVRWMKSRLLRYEVAEDLGGRLIHD